MNINKSLYAHFYSVRSAQNKEAGIDTKRYSFIFQKELGRNGLWENHELKGKEVIDKESGEKYSIDDVYLHWYYGWYFVASIRDKNNSHSQMRWNVTQNEFAEANFHEFSLVDYEYDFLKDFKD